jgi:hypothetical protein
VRACGCMCVSERGQLVSECPLESPPVEGGVTSSSETPPLIEEEAPFLNTKTKIYCAEEGQQQFNPPREPGMASEWKVMAKRP